jgi:hypothetical protein
MNSFQTMPMHMCFLGIEKSLTAKTSLLAYRSNPCQNTAWKQLIYAMQGSQETINSVYLVWCLSMKFSDLENKKSQNCQLAIRSLLGIHPGVIVSFFTSRSG